MRGTDHGRSKYVLNMNVENGVELAHMFKANF